MIKKYLKKNYFLIFSIGNLLLFDLSYFTHKGLVFDLLVVQSIIFLLVIPGLYLYILFLPKKYSVINIAVFSITLSICFLLGCGLINNTFLPVLGIQNPLESSWLYLSLNLFLILLFLIALKKVKLISIIINKNLQKINLQTICISSIPLLLLFLSVIGSFQLNNNIQNILPEISLICFLLFIIILYSFRNYVREGIFPYTIYLLSCTLLFQYSLRSNFVSGPDVSLEYKMFALTAQHSYWSLSFLRQAYNACLSVSLFPAELSNIFHLNGTFIFKVLFPLFFSLTGVIVYLIILDYFPFTYALLGSLFFVTNIYTTIDSVTIERQAFAAIFFAMAIYIYFNKYFEQKNAIFLFILFNLVMVVSHYSTSFIAIACYFLVYLSLLLISFFSKLKFNNLTLNNDTQTNNRNNLLNLRVLILLSLITYLWWGQVASNIINVPQYMRSFISNINSINNSNVRAEKTSIISQFTETNTKQPQILLNQYLNEINKNINMKVNNPNSYRVKLSQSIYLPLTTNQLFASIVYKASNIIKVLMKIMLLTGLALIFIFRKFFKRISINYIAFSISGIFLLILIAILPNASIDYDIERLYEQLLIFLTLGWVACIVFMNRFFNTKLRNVFILFIFILYFFANSQLLTQMLGGTTASMSFDNSGTNYDRFYVHDSEAFESMWLNKNISFPNTVYADADTRRKLLSLTTFSINSVYTYTVPGSVSKNGYVFMDYDNTVEKRGYLYYLGETIPYLYPITYFEQNKNLIYNNGDTTIFK